ncbi:MAG: hypothetical protein ACHQQ3_13325 [Gemmatimonadales bacterium]
MTSTRVAVTVVALLATATTVAHGQVRAARWAGGGSGVSSTSSQQQTHTHVTYQGPMLVVPGTPLTRSTSASQGQAPGGSWNGARPTSGGSPAAQSRQQGTDLSAFFGYVPPRGQSAQNVTGENTQNSGRAVARRTVTSITTPATTPPQEHHSRITWP